VVQRLLHRGGGDARVSPVRDREITQPNRIAQPRRAVPRLVQLLRLEEPGGQPLAAVVLGLDLKVVTGHPRDLGTADDGHPGRHRQFRGERAEHLGAYGERIRRPTRPVGVQPAPHVEAALRLHHAGERATDVELHELRTIRADDHVRPRHAVRVPLVEQRVTQPELVLAGRHPVGRQPLPSAGRGLQGGPSQQLHQDTGHPEELRVRGTGDGHRRGRQHRLVRPAGLVQHAAQAVPERVRRRGRRQPLVAEPRVSRRGDRFSPAHPAPPPRRGAPPPQRCPQ